MRWRPGFWEAGGRRRRVCELVVVCMYVCMRMDESVLSGSLVRWRGLHCIALRLSELSRRLSAETLGVCASACMLDTRRKKAWMDGFTNRLGYYLIHGKERGAHLVFSGCLFVAKSNILIFSLSHGCKPWSWQPLRCLR